MLTASKTILETVTLDRVWPILSLSTKKGVAEDVESAYRKLGKWRPGAKELKDIANGLKVACNQEERKNDRIDL